MYHSVIVRFVVFCCLLICCSPVFSAYECISKGCCNQVTHNGMLCLNCLTNTSKKKPEKTVTPEPPESDSDGYTAGVALCSEDNDHPTAAPSTKPLTPNIYASHSSTLVSPPSKNLPSLNRPTFTPIQPPHSKPLPQDISDQQNGFFTPSLGCPPDANKIAMLHNRVLDKKYHRGAIIEAITSPLQCSPLTPLMKNLTLEWSFTQSNSLESTSLLLSFLLWQQHPWKISIPDKLPTEIKDEWQALASLEWPEKLSRSGWKKFRFKCEAEYLRCFARDTAREKIYRMPNKACRTLFRKMRPGMPAILVNKESTHRAVAIWSSRLQPGTFWVYCPDVNLYRIQGKPTPDSYLYAGLLKETDGWAIDALFHTIKTLMSDRPLDQLYLYCSPTVIEPENKRVLQKAATIKDYPSVTLPGSPSVEIPPVRFKVKSPKPRKNNTQPLKPTTEAVNTRLPDPNNDEPDDVPVKAPEKKTCAAHPAMGKRYPDALSCSLWV